MEMRDQQVELLQEEIIVVMLIHHKNTQVIQFKNKEIIELAESFSIIDKSGAWYTLEFLEGHKDFPEVPKFQGQSKLYDFLESRPDIFKMVLEKVQEVLS